MSLTPEKFYEHEEHDVTKCGRCWAEDIKKTLNGEYTGDEAVRAVDLRLLSDEWPYQCDECLTQNEAYEELGNND